MEKLINAAKKAGKQKSVIKLLKMDKTQKLMRLIDKIGKEIQAVPEYAENSSVHYFEQTLVEVLAKSDIMYATIIDQLNGVLYAKQQYNLSYCYQAIFSGYRRYLKLQIYFFFGYLRALRVNIKAELLKSGEKLIKIDQEDFKKLEDLLSQLPVEKQKEERDRISLKYCDIKFDDPKIIEASEALKSAGKEKQNKEFAAFLEDMMLNNTKDLPISGELNIMKFKDLYQMKRILTSQEYALKQIITDKRKVQTCLRKAFQNKQNIEKMRHSGVEYKLKGLLQDLEKHKDENNKYVKRFKPAYLERIGPAQIKQNILRKVVKKMFKKTHLNQASQTRPINLKNLQESLGAVNVKLEEKLKIINIQRKSISDMRETDEKLKKKNDELRVQNEDFKLILIQNGLLESEIKDEFQEMLSNLKLKAEKVKPLQQRISFCEKEVRSLKKENGEMMMKLEKIKDEMKFKEKIINQKNQTEIKQISTKHKVVNLINKVMISNIKSKQKLELENQEKDVHMEKMKTMLEADEIIESAKKKEEEKEKEKATVKKDTKEKKKKKKKKVISKQQSKRSQKSLKSQKKLPNIEDKIEEEEEDEVAKQIRLLKQEMKEAELRKLKTQNQVEKKKELLNDDSDSVLVIESEEEEDEEQESEEKKIFMNRAVQTMRPKQIDIKKLTKKEIEKPKKKKQKIKKEKTKKIEEIQESENEEEIIEQTQVVKKKKKKKKRIVVETESEESSSTEEEIIYKKRKKKKKKKKRKQSQETLDVPRGRESKKSSRIHSRQASKDDKKMKAIKKDKFRIKIKAVKKSPEEGLKSDKGKVKKSAREGRKHKIKKSARSLGKSKEQAVKKSARGREQTKESRKSQERSPHKVKKDKQKSKLRERKRVSSKESVRSKKLQSKKKSQPRSKSHAKLKVKKSKKMERKIQQEITVINDNISEQSSHKDQSMEQTISSKEEKTNSLSEQQKLENSTIKFEAQQQELSKEITENNAPLQDWLSEEEEKEEINPDIQNDSLHHIDELPNTVFNWREHISTKDKEDCDTLINEIIKMPKNIKAFNDLLKIFQSFTGEQVDLSSSLKIFPEFFRQPQETVQSNIRSRETMPAMNRNHNSFSQAKILPQLNNTMQLEQPWRQQQQYIPNIQQNKQFSKYYQNRDQINKTRESFHLQQTAKMNPFGFQKNFKKKMLNNLLRKKTKVTRSYHQTKQSFRKSSNDTWQHSDMEQSEEVCTHLKRFNDRKKDAMGNRKLLVLSTLLISKLPKKNKRMQIKRKRRKRLIQRKRNQFTEYTMFPNSTFERVDINYML